MKLRVRENNFLIRLDLFFWEANDFCLVELLLRELFAIPLFFLIQFNVESSSSETFLLII